MATDRLSLPSLYAILDPEQVGDRSTQAALREMLQAGIEILQLRAKALAPRDFLAFACKARELTRACGCRLIVNDRVDIALACDADGVHLGQDDLPLHAARRLLPGRLIGISTHDSAQAKAAEQGGADYIGFGPMFGTTTKTTGYSERGTAMLREVRADVAIPIVAIGGINEGNVSAVWEAGADAAAIISDILGAADITVKIKRILSRHSGRSG